MNNIFIYKAQQIENYVQVKQEIFIIVQFAKEALLLECKKVKIKVNMPKLE